MAVYTSKFTGQQIDDALDQIATFEGRLTALESKEDKDTIYDDAELIARIEALEARLAASTPGQDPSQDTNSGTGENPEGTTEGTPEQNTENIISENSEGN